MAELGGLAGWNWTLQGVGVVCSLVGASLNARLDIRGFYFWLAANGALCVVHATSRLWLLCVLDVIYCVINLRGIGQWRRVRLLQRILSK